MKLMIDVAKQFLDLETDFIDVSRPGEVRVTTRYLNEETNSRVDPSRRREGRVVKDVGDFLEMIMYLIIE